MKSLASAGILLVAVILLNACGGTSGTPPTLSGAQVPQAQLSSAQNPAMVNHWTPTFITLPAQNVDESTLESQAAASVTVPFYTASITSPLTHSTYTYHIVGANPATSTVTTNIMYVPIIARVHFAGGVVLDPTKPGCGDTVSVENRFLKGPNFVPVALKSNGISVGTTQLTDGFQRAEFWSHTKATAYHTVLVAAHAPIIVDVTAPTGSATFTGVCTGTAHDLGTIDINAYDSIVRSLAAAHATTAQVPIVLTYNVFQTSGGQCCILGYHSAFGRTGGTQVYSVGAYNDAGVFSEPIEDVHAWTHELGELFNDPFVNNATPTWGHIGQVSGCQGNLEVGDPLTGTAFTVVSGGFTYHPQELAFFDWFYRTKPQGTSADFSFNETFESAQGACT